MSGVPWRSRRRGARGLLVVAALLGCCGAQPLWAGAQIEIVTADDDRVTYRELVPLRVAMDERRGVYHVAGCPALAADMPWVSPGMATLRGLQPHDCAAHPRDTYVTKVVSRRPREAGAVSVLFLGNSLTYYNEVPRMTAAIAAQEPRPLRVEAVTMSGASLDQLWTSTRALEKLWTAHWDYVVLQDRGGSAPRTRAAAFALWVGRFAEEARKSGARVLLYMTWDPGHEAENAALFARVAAKAGARVVPVAAAWRELLAAGDFATLEWDGTHPDLHGSYLVACSMFAAIYGKPPFEVPFTFPGLAVADEAYDEALRTQRLAPAQARAIQRAAWAAQQRWRP